MKSITHRWAADYCRHEGRHCAYYAGVLGLWIAALGLAIVGLGDPSLGPFDEGIMARVSLELSDSKWPNSLFPTLWGSDYLNKPPGLHWLVALTIRVWRISASADPTSLPPEWVLRLVPALVSTLIVPITGLLQGQLLPGMPLASLAASVIVLTVLPVAAHGRVAMLDGAQLSAMHGCWFFLLCSRAPAWRGRISSVLAGLCGSCLLLMKAPVALPVLVFGFLLLSTEPEVGTGCWRRIAAPVAWGLLPGLSWHVASLLHHGPLALVMWWQEGYARGATLASEYQGSWQFLPLEFMRGSLPWLPLWPLGLIQSVHSLPSRWSRWSLGLTAVTILMAVAVKPHRIWYSVLIWPPFALLCSVIFARLLTPGQANNRLRQLVGLFWFLTGIAMLVELRSGGMIFSDTLLVGYRNAFSVLALAILVAGMTLLSGSLRPCRIVVLGLAVFWYITLMSVFLSPHWHPWSVGQMNRRHIEQLRITLNRNGVSQPIYSDHYDYIRNWYLRTHVKLLPSSPDGLPTSFTALLLDPKAINAKLSRDGIHCQTSTILDRPGPAEVRVETQPLFVQVCRREMMHREQPASGGYHRQRNLGADGISPLKRGMPTPQAVPATRSPISWAMVRPARSSISSRADDPVGSAR
jgi:hypothetical protein